MVKAVIIRPRSDNAGSSTTLDSVSYDGITINFDDDKTSDDFYNGHTDGSITSAFSPSYQSGLTWMLINGLWPSDPAASNGVDGINTISLKGLDLTTRYIPVTFTPGDRIEDFMNMHWAGHGDNVGTLADNFEELKLVSIASGGWGNPDVYGTQFSFDFLTGVVSYDVTNNPPLGTSGWHKIDITDNYLYACGQGDGVFNGELSKYLWGVSGTQVSYAIQIKPKAAVVGDTTAPTISQVTAIPTPSNNTTPSYTFTTDEVGTLTTNITQGFSGGSSVTITGTGNKTVTFATLPEGTYTGKTITLTDADSNASTLTIPTFIIDTTNPVITLNGSATITLNKGDIYNEAGATATDNPGSVNLTASITTTGTVNPDVAGTYTVTYNVTDAAGNTATAITRTVTVTADTTAPIISQITAIPTPSNNTTPSYTFTTDEVGTLTTNITQGFSGGSSVTITGTGNKTVTFATLPEGTYTGKTITLTDADSNASTLTIPTFIIDTTNPVITLNGSATITLNKGDIYNEAGATATDNPGSVNLTASITTTGTVNPDVAGTYTVTYNVTDAAGNTATAITRTVTVTALDELTYFWTVYNDASNNTEIHYGIYNTRKISGVQFTYDVSGSTTVADVSYSIVDNTDNNTMIHKKDWPIHIINNTIDEANKAMVFAGSVDQTINGMNTGVFAIVKGNVTLASIVAVVDDNSDLLLASEYVIGEPANPPEITEPGGRKLGDINFDGVVDGTDAEILEAYLLNDSATFTVYDDGTTNNETTGKTAGDIITDMTEYDLQTYVDVNNNGKIDVGDLVRLLSKIADSNFSMTNGT